MNEELLGVCGHRRRAGVLLDGCGRFVHLLALLFADFLYLGSQIGNERYAIAGVLAAQHPNGLVGGRGCHIALGALRGVAGVTLTSNLCGDNIFGPFLRFSRSEPNRGWLELDLYLLLNLLDLCRVRQRRQHALRVGQVVA